MPILYWKKVRRGVLTLPSIPARPSPVLGGKPIPATGIRSVQFTDHKASVSKADFDSFITKHPLWKSKQLVVWVPPPPGGAKAPADAPALRRLRLAAPARPADEAEELHAFCLPDGAKAVLKGDGQRTAREMLRLAAQGQFKELPSPLVKEAKP